ncbi:hypothetical protein GG344DRAFT_71626, partial [Lentinula edodes]
MNFTAGDIVISSIGGQKWPGLVLARDDPTIPLNDRPTSSETPILWETDEYSTVPTTSLKLLSLAEINVILQKRRLKLPLMRAFEWAREKVQSQSNTKEVKYTITGLTILLTPKKVENAGDILNTGISGSITQQSLELPILQGGIMINTLLQNNDLPSQKNQHNEGKEEKLPSIPDMKAVTNNIPP